MTTKWILDPLHTEVQFKAKHLLISTVTGSFTKFDGTVETDGENFETARIHFEIDANSLTTGAEQRDTHLRSDDFFNAEKYPKITFDSSSMKKISGDKYELTGDLTIRDITKTVKLDVEFGGSMVDFYGNKKAGFEVTGKINRKEFGLKWHAVTEAGGIVVGDEIKMVCQVQFAKQNEPSTAEAA